MFYIYIYIYVYVYIYIYICLYVYLCIYMCVLVNYLFNRQSFLYCAVRMEKYEAIFCVCICRLVKQRNIIYIVFGYHSHMHQHMYE